MGIVSKRNNAFITKNSSKRTARPKLYPKKDCLWPHNEKRQQILESIIISAGISNLPEFEVFSKDRTRKKESGKLVNQYMCE